MQSNAVVVFHVFLHIADGGLAGVIHPVANPLFLVAFEEALHHRVDAPMSRMSGSTAHATPPARKSSLTCSSTSRCSTTGVAATPRSRASRRFSSCGTGSVLSMGRTWQHDHRPLEDGKQGEAPCMHESSAQFVLLVI